MGDMLQSAVKVESGSTLRARMAQHVQQFPHEAGMSGEQSLCFLEGLLVCPAQRLLRGMRVLPANPGSRDSTRPHWSRLSSISAISFWQSGKLVPRNCSKAARALDKGSSPPNRARVRRAARV